MYNEKMNKITQLTLVILLFTKLVFAEENVATPATTPETKYKLTQIASGYKNVTQFTNSNCSTSETFVALREGKIYTLGKSPETSRLILDISEKIIPGENGGLIGLAIHPDFEKNNKFYVHYIAKGKEDAHIISQYTYSASSDASEEIKIMTFPVNIPVYNSGGQMLFGHDDMLYIGIGDNSKLNDSNNTGQNNFDVYGSILRIKVDPEDLSSKTYLVPHDNPFNNNGSGNEIVYTYGMRNPKTLILDNLKHSIFSSDSGEGVAIEINKVLSGRNYGWSMFDGTNCMGMKFECLGKYYEPPYFNLENKNHSEIILGAVYYGTKLSNLIGNIIFADSQNRKIYALTNEDSPQSKVVIETPSPIQAISTDTNSEIIVALITGEIFRLEAEIDEIKK